MKKYLQLTALFAVLILVAAVSPAWAYDEDDQTVGGATAAGASAHGKALVFSGTYDFSAQTYATNQVVKLVNVPEGYLVDKIVVSATGLDQVITNTLYKYTTDWASDADSQAFAKTTDASVVYYRNLPSYTATLVQTQAPSATNSVVSGANGVITGITNAVTVAVDDEATGTVDALAYGFIATLSTNGAPTAGKLRIAVRATDVAPWLRED